MQKKSGSVFAQSSKCKEGSVGFSVVAVIVIVVADAAAAVVLFDV